MRPPQTHTRLIQSLSVFNVHEESCSAGLKWGLRICTLISSPTHSDERGHSGGSLDFYVKLSTLTKHRCFPGAVLDSWSLEINEEAWHVAELYLCLYECLKCITSATLWNHMTSGDVYIVFETLFPDMSNITYHIFRQMR